MDQIRDFSTQRKQLNTKLLMAKDLPTLLRIVDDHVRICMNTGGLLYTDTDGVYGIVTHTQQAGEMNDVNICTAVVRVARFSSNQTPRKNRVVRSHAWQTFPP